MMKALVTAGLATGLRKEGGSGGHSHISAIAGSTHSRDLYWMYIHRILTSGRGTSTLHIKMSGDLKVVLQWCKCVVPHKYVKSWRAKNSL